MQDSSKIYFNIYCIDKRFDSLSGKYFKAIGFSQNFYLGTTAGSALCLGYSQYCQEICNCHREYNSIHKYDPKNPDMLLLKDSLIKNIDISFSLNIIDEIYLLNHQDCGAIKAYLSFSGYPQTMGDNNSLEIKINTELLLFASEYLKKKYPNVVIRLGLIDINGTVCDYDIQFHSWRLVYRGSSNDPLGLWYGL